LRRVSAHESRGECVRAAEARIRDILGRGVTIARLSNGMISADAIDGKSVVLTQCWPDTIDPRGPKGK
jgi:hypothetical protein